MYVVVHVVVHVVVCGHTGIATLGGWASAERLFAKRLSFATIITPPLETICEPRRPLRDHLATTRTLLRPGRKGGTGGGVQGGSRGVVAMCRRINERQESACLLMERKPPARRLSRPGAAVLAPGWSYKTPEGFPGRSRLHASFEERKRPPVEKREAAIGRLDVAGVDATSCLGDRADLITD